MRYSICCLTLLVPTLLIADRPKDLPRSGGVLVLDDCDADFWGKAFHEDRLTLVDSEGRQAFRSSGFNNCQAIGSSRAVTTDPRRRCVWTVENRAGRLRRFDLAGVETVAVEGVRASALAVDPETGNVWVLESQAWVAGGKTVVYDERGAKVASHGTKGWDIVYDKTAKAFWVADKDLTKVSAADGKVLVSVPVSTWCASSVDVDPKSGAAWVAVREHPQVAGSKNRLLKFGPKGEELAAVDLGKKVPFRVSVDPKDGSVWVAHLRQSVERFSGEGKSLADHPLTALAVQADPAGGDAWVATDTEVVRLTRRGEVTSRLSHAGKTSQAWIAALDFE